MWIRIPVTIIITFLVLNLIIDSAVIIVGVFVRPGMLGDLADFLTRRVPGVVTEVLGIAWIWLCLFSVISGFAHCVWNSIRSNLAQSFLFAGALSLVLYAVGVARGLALYGHKWGEIEHTWIKIGWLPSVIAAIGTHWILYRVFRAWDRHSLSSEATEQSP
ncbi:MAG: hypothetical protein AAF585_14635 [Verrucomicrobiota bacterium]